MTSRLELNSRAALCRQLAKREPAGRTLWMAEAENWSRLVERELHGEADCFPHLGTFAGAVGKMPSFSVLDMSGQLIRFSIPIATVAIFGAAAFPICWVVLALLGF
jgi:hypothetical protein